MKVRNASAGHRRCEHIASSRRVICKLAIAFGVTRQLNGEDLTGERIWLEEFRKFPGSAIEAGKRIGVDYAGEDANKPLRFWVKANPFVSKLPKRLRK